MATYAEKLKDPRWQKMRFYIFSRDNWACTQCKSTTNSLQVHHIRYFKNCNPWEYDERYLITLCEICHKSEHGIAPSIQQLESVFDFLLPTYDEPNVIISINQQLNQLTAKLKEGVEPGLEEAILKNLIFLYAKKSEVTNG